MSFNAGQGGERNECGGVWRVIGYRSIGREVEGDEWLVV